MHASPAMHTPLLHMPFPPCTPPTMHTLCHACPTTMHTPVMHAPCHACPCTHMPPATHTSMSCTPLPHHTYPPPPVNRITDACVKTTLPQLHCGRYLINERFTRWLRFEGCKGVRGGANVHEGVSKMFFASQLSLSVKSSIFFY